MFCAKLPKIRYWMNLPILFLILCSCSQQSQPSFHKAGVNGKIDKVVCKEDTTQGYMVYLPSWYQEKSKWPVMFMFDSHGNGQLAIEKARTAAEVFGYILVGSNNSKNGEANIGHILSILYEDVLSRYPVNENRLYAAGFSGGGRVAQELAFSTGKIKAVLTCSAGLSNLEPQQLSHPVDIYGITGLEDFNYEEVLAIPGQLNNSGWRTAVSAFNGGHSWPPEESILQAFRWFELNAIKDKLADDNRGNIKALMDSALSDINRFMKDNQYALAVQVCENAITQFKSLKSTKDLEKKLSEIRNMAAFKLEISKDEKLKYQEQQLRNGYAQSFMQEDTSWWRNEIQNLNLELSKDISYENDLHYHQMLCRVKGFLGIISYSYTSNAVASGKYEDAQKFIQLYQMIEPENPDCFFYKAVLEEKKGKNREAVQSLKQAVKYGFSDREKLRQSFSEKTVKEIFR